MTLSLIKNMYTFVDIKGWKYIHHSMYSDYLWAFYLYMISFIEIFFIFPKFVTCLSYYTGQTITF